MQHIEGVACSNMIDGRLVSFFVGNKGDLIQRHHLHGQFYEQEELGIIARHFTPGSVFADIGANVGNHSVYVGLFLEPAMIVPFEPNPAVVPVLRINLLLNNLSQIVDDAQIGIGLSDDIGDADPFTPDMTNLGLTKMQMGGGAGTIPLMPGDWVFEGRTVDFIKVDVEGMEMRVLAGLAATIARCRPNLFVEVDDANAAAFAGWLDHNGYCQAERFRRYVGNENYMVVPRERA